MSDDTAFVLEWDLACKGDPDYNAYVERFDGWEDTARLVKGRSMDLPDEIVFETNFRWADQVDYLLNDVHWPIMRRSAYQAMARLSDFEHDVFEVVLVDDTVPTGHRRDEHDVIRSDHRNDDFVAIRVPLLDRGTGYDPDASELETDEYFTTVIQRLVTRV